MAPPINATKPAVVRAPKTEPALVPGPAAPAVEARPSAPVGSGFDAKAKKPVSLTGTGNYNKLVRNGAAGLAAGVGAGAKAPAAMVLPPPVKLDKSGQETLDAIRKIKGPDRTIQVGGMLGTLSPDQAKAVWKAMSPDEKAAILADIKKNPKHDSGAIELARVSSMSNPELAAELKAMRAHPSAQPGPKELALGTERAVRTQWAGASEANKAVIAQLRQSVNTGQVTFTNGEGAARTNASDGTITVDPAMAKSPEALAAKLAHEATHASHQKKDGAFDKSLYVEETKANVASSAVWNEIGDPSDKGLSSNALEGLNDYAAQYAAHGEDGVKARMAAEYTHNAVSNYTGHVDGSDKPVKVSAATKKQSAADVADLVNHLAGDAGAQKSLTPEYLDELITGVMVTASDADKADLLTTLGKALKNAPPEVKAYLETQAKVAVRTDAVAQLHKGMN